MLALTTPALAGAGGAATIESVAENGAIRMDISWRDRNMRLDLPSQQNAYILMRGGKAYSVSTQGGRTMVLDMSALEQMGPMAGAAGGAGAPSMGADSFNSLERLEATGEAETVAGIEGEVYEIAWTDGQGETHEDTAVLSDDALVRGLTDAFRRSSQAMGAGSNPLSAALAERDAGVLRFSDKFKVVKISADAPPAGEFELPAEPMSLQDLMRGVQ